MKRLHRLWVWTYVLTSFAISSAGLADTDRQEAQKKDIHRVVLVRVSKTKQGKIVRETEDLRSARSADYGLVIPERGFDLNSYFEKVIRPRLSKIAPNPSDLSDAEQWENHPEKFRNLPVYYFSVEAKIRLLSENDWAAYVQKTRQQLSKNLVLPKGEAFHTECLLIYDPTDGQIRANQTLLTEMEADGAFVELAAAHLRLGLYLWAMDRLHGETEGKVRPYFFKKLSRFVAHLLSDEPADEVAEWYQDEAADEEPVRQPLSIRRFQLVGFVPHGVEEKRFITEKFDKACNDWKKIADGKLSEKSVFVAQLGCEPIQREGTYTYQSTGRMTETRRGSVLAMIGKAEVLPRNHFASVDRTEVGDFFQTAVLRKRNDSLWDYNEMYAVQLLCNAALDRIFTKQKDFTFYAYCTESTGLRTLESLDFWPGNSMVAYYRTQIRHIVSSKHRIKTRSEAYSISGQWLYSDRPESIRGGMSHLDAKYSQLEQKEKERYGNRFLLGVPYSKDISFVRKDDYLDLSISATAMFLHVSSR